MKTGRSGIQGHLQLDEEFEASLEYMSPCRQVVIGAKMWKQSESTDEGTDSISSANMFVGWYSASKRNEFLPCNNTHRP